MTFIECIIVVAMIAAFIITLAKKWGFVEYMQVYGNELFSKMFHCDLCLSWWACCIVSCIFFAASGNPYFVAAPFCSTMICRFVL